MNNDIKLIAEAYNQQMNDMKATMNAPPESRDSGSLPLDNGHYFEWWKDAQGIMSGTIYDKNDIVIQTIDPEEDEYAYSELAELGAREDEAPIKDTNIADQLKRYKATSGIAKISSNLVSSIKDLAAMPEKTIVFYPEHATNTGAFAPRSVLLEWLKSVDPTGGFVQKFIRTMPPVTDKVRSLMEEAKRELSNINCERVVLWVESDEFPLMGVADEGDYETIFCFMQGLIQAGWAIAHTGYGGDHYNDPNNIMYYWAFD